MLKGKENNFELNIMLMERFEQHVAESPENTAVIDNGRSYSYRDLNIRANKIAHYLRNFGVGKGDPVGVMMNRSYEMICAVFGIWKAGGVYLPIDKNWPVQRKKNIFQDSGLQMVLVSDMEDIVNGGEAELVSVNSDEIKNADCDNPVHCVEKEDVSYVIYTSGSTGNPKGVQVGHEALINRILWMQQEFPIGAGDIILQKTVYTFDVSVWEIVWWAITGAGVCLLPSGKESSIKTIIRYIEKYHVSVIHFVPSVFKLFLDYIRTEFNLSRINSIRYYFSSGEALLPQFVNEFHQVLNEGGLQSVLVNLYGPTEAAIDTSFYVCRRDTREWEIPIGKPIDNTYLYVMDESGKHLPPNETGLLFIGGIGLAKGYLNQEELTEKMFVEDPYLPGHRIYNTGDLAMYREDGNVLYCGRKDEQVKINGIRIELGEIEHQISHCEGIKEAIVLCSESGGSNVLTAFLVMAHKKKYPNAVMLRDKLSEILPKYMIPSCFYRIERIPVKPNGKLDKQQLKEWITEENAV